MTALEESELLERARQYVRDVTTPDGPLPSEPLVDLICDLVTSLESARKELERARERCAEVFGMSHTKTYNTWARMIDRCNNQNHPGYKYYGARGIQVCDRWRYSFENFLADMGEHPAGLSIDRINNDGGYEPGNCRWATSKQQAANKRKRGTASCQA